MLDVTCDADDFRWWEPRQPQLFADRFGWPEMVATVAKVYLGLPPEERAKTQRE